jgi:hypothetical protein
MRRNVWRSQLDRLLGAAEGAFADGAQHLGALLDPMLGAGVTADVE